MGESMFMKADEVARELDVSVSYAYKVIKRMNEELKEKNYITMRGKIDRKFFREHFYGTHGEKERSDQNAGLQG